MSYDYDVIVIGAGAVGENVADYATRGGLKVALVENELVGGECSYWACMPSKALLRPGAALHAALSVEGAKQAIPSQAKLDVPAVLARRDAATSQWDDSGQVKWTKSAGIDLVRGTAEITDIRKVTIDSRTYTARYAVVAATGSSAFVPDVPGLRDAKPWTSREATSAKSIPESLIVVGGGVVACEMATAYAGLGSKVSMVVRGQTLLGGQEDFAGQLVAEALEKLGVSIFLNTSLSKVERSGTSVTAALHGGQNIQASEILVATGRTPNTANLGVKQFQLPTLPGGWLDVDDSLLVRTTDWLYAVGDVNGRALLTHQGKYQARAAGSVIAARALGKGLHTDAWGIHVATADGSAVPQVTFTNPEVASVGLMSHIAAQKGINAKAVDYNLAWLAGSSVYSDDYKGQARLVVDIDRDVVPRSPSLGAFP
ncbi:dihydrolipoamide dehydrogenase [Rhizoctonia solani AG-1 IB]|uniref:Dihydrolipoamide dehydrogenase n=1 Tax=Thanatephorus cucumeris (strain AG1-IB / isolate 7/3/14) TaxID=1108050 RepID=M5BQR7_THACB|nr:dihydrolipoamide dehydrogenase [Rhizoctonia solani AG-1 IB]